MRLNNFVHYYTGDQVHAVLANYNIPVPSSIYMGTVLLCTADESESFYNFLLYFGRYGIDPAAIWNAEDKQWEYV